MRWNYIFAVLAGFSAMGAHASTAPDRMSQKPVPSVAVHFEHGSATLSRSAKFALDQLAKQAASLKGQSAMVVIGFADSDGETRQNDWLGSDRAMAAGRFLASKLPEGYLLEIRSEGERGQTAHCKADGLKGESCKAEQRKVEVVLISK